MGTRKEAKARGAPLVAYSLVVQSGKPIQMQIGRMGTFYFGFVLVSDLLFEGLRTSFA